MHARAGHLSWLVALPLVLAACTHDLDRLRAGTPGGLRRDGGTEADASGGERDAGAPSAGACEPCEPLTPAAEQLGLRTCCRGSTGRECGLTFGEGSLCLPRDVPGKPDSACADLTTRGMRLAGCCRPDARCGLTAAGLGLGCVARDEILPALASGSSDPVECRYTCEEDADCGLEADDFVCAETPGQRLCADACERDLDCRRWDGKVCALANDLGRNRVLAICRPPVGDVPAGELCTAADDCVTGVCLATSDSEGVCSELCKNDADCASRNCVGSDIQRPMRESGTERLFICGI